MEEIQEMIDVNKDKMPMSLAIDLLKLCAKKGEGLYKVKYAKFSAQGYLDGEEMVPRVLTDAEYCETICEGGGTWLDFVKGEAKIPQGWLNDKPPALKYAIVTCNDVTEKGFVIFSVEKYVKRNRE